MILAKLAPVFLFLLFNEVNSGDSGSDEGNPKCVMYPTKIYMCKDTLAKSDFKAHSKDTDDPNAKKFSFDINLSEDITDSTVFEIHAERWEDGYWKTFINHAGPLCENQQQMFPKAAEKIRTLVKPAIPDQCVIKAGHYELDDFELEKDDFDIPMGEENRLLVLMKLVTRTKKDILCAMGEFDVKC